MDIIFLGLNDVGMRIYDWLTERDSVTVSALLTEPDQLELVHRESPDAIVSVGYDYRVPREVLEVPEQGAINLHPGFLPYNRGKSPNVWPLIEETPAGVTLHYMNEEFDAGGIISQRKVDTEFSDTGKTVHQRLEEAQFELFTDAWPRIEDGEVTSKPQNTKSGTYHTTQDFRDICELDPEAEVQVREFLDRLRALTFPPFDNAYIEIGDQKYHVDVDIREADSEDTEPDGLLTSY